MISSDAQLAQLLPELQRSPWLAIDTEADSLHAYPEKLCLIQVSYEGGDALVDPLSPVSLSPLLELFGERELLLHGADFDLRLLRRTQGFVADRVFDTMLAARLLGHQKFGLRDLAAQLLDVHLDKGSQRANWSRRPLTPKMARYAIADTHHLQPIATQLRAQLVETGREAWHAESCARLVRACQDTAGPDPDRVWRLKGSGRLDRRGLAVLRALWGWREEEAVARDRPPYFIASHEILLGICKKAPEEIGKALPSSLGGRQRRELTKVALQAHQLPPESWPTRDGATKPPKLTAATRDRIGALQKHRNSVAAELGIDPTLIANKAAITALAQEAEGAASALMSWQRSLLEV